MNERKSLRATILIRVVPITAMALLLIVMVARYGILQMIKSEVITRLEQASFITADALGGRLDLLRESAAGLAENDLIIHSIVDKSQRKEQLAVFFRSLKLPSPAFRRVTMTDYRGRIVASSDVQRTGVQNGIEVRDFLEKVMQGSDHFELDSDRIIMATPVRYSGNAEAVIAIEYATTAFMKEFQTLDAGHHLQVFGSGGALYSSDQREQGVSPWIASTQQVRGYPNLRVERSESPEIAYASVRSLDTFFAGVLLACLASLLYGIFAAANAVTEPLTRMVGQIEQIEASDDLSQRVDDGGPREIQNLTSSFNSMIGSLSRTTVSLDRLQRSEERLRVIIESVPNGIIGTDDEGKIVLVNAGIESMFGFSRTDLVGQSIEMLVPPSQRERHKVDRVQFMRAPEPRSMAQRRELFGLHRSGDAIPVEIELTPMERNDDMRISVLASVVDVSERRRQEQKISEKNQIIHENEERLSLAVRTANIGLWDWNIGSSYVRVSPELSAHLGEETAYQDYPGWRARVHPEDWDQADAAVVDCIEGKSSRYEATFRMRHRDSSYRWILAQGQLIRDGDGEPDRMIGVHIDITDQQLAADELQQVNQNLSRSNDELEQFAYVASHDLQEPLRKVTSFCELLREDCEESLSEDGRRFLGYVVDGATRMRTLIQDLLSFSRIESQGQTHSLVDANKAVLRASRSLAAIIEEAGAEVTHDQLPEVVADSTQLTQLLQNLIGNAIKYNGNPIPQVHISSELRDASWVFSVRDNGIGIEPQYFEQIFGVFKRLHSMDTYRGTGIGLAICKRIVDRMSGEIWVESSPGEGSTFFFSVPNPVS